MAMDVPAIKLRDYLFRRPWTPPDGFWYIVLSHNVWRSPPRALVVQQVRATMLFFVIPFTLAISLLAIWKGLCRLCLLEAADQFGANLLLKGTNVGLQALIAAILHGHLKLRLHKATDPDVSITQREYESADTPHPRCLRSQDWKEVADAALNSTREAMEYFKHCGDFGEGANLYLFIQAVILSTFFHVFFQLPITPPNMEDVAWIGGKTRRTSCCKPIGNPIELSRLIKSSPNPWGVFVPLSIARRTVLAAACTLEGHGEKIHFLRRAASLLRDPTRPDSVVDQVVQKAKEFEPPIQAVCGRISLGSIPLCGTCKIDFFIPVDSVPPSACILVGDGSCVSWIHKAGLPGSAECGGDKWMLHASTIILSAIQTETRKAGLTVDWDERDLEAWEKWTLRRLRVG